jgi:serine/threonine protein kinase
MSAASASPSEAASRHPAKLGRFRVVRELGHGAQGRVYLACDDQLQREVAIKTIAAGHDPQRAQSLLAEARTIARLQHPNVVTLYDAFEDAGLQCVVLEYVSGETLETLLARSGPLEPGRAAAIGLQILDGLACAHERGIVHRDIKPANVLVDAAGNARLTDFGIASAAGPASFQTTLGTPRYMAPETIDGREVAQAADVFSVGMTLYECLAGRPAVEGASVYEVLHKIANHPFRPPSALNGAVTEALDQIVMRALAKDPQARYTNAAEMRRALQALCQPAHLEAAPGAAPDGGGAVDFLLARMRLKSSFPALSGSIGAINRIAAQPEQSVQALSEVLLKDFALTNKLLRIVNSSGYGHYGGTISTISRAVLILGFDVVRDLAITLVLFEHLHNKGQATRLRDDVIQSLFTGIVARRVGRSAGIRDGEEGFVCGVFRNFGRLLAGFYLYEESLEVARCVQQTGQDEEQASRAVLGASYGEIGTAVAKSWNLPPTLIEAMQPLADERPVRPTSQAQRLQVSAALADALARAATAGAPEARERQLAAIAERFSDALRIDAKELGRIAAESVQELLEDTPALIGDSRKSRFCQVLQQTAGKRAEQPAPDGLERAIEHSESMCVRGPEAQADAAQVLSAGIQDITNSLVDNCNLSDLLRIILETMYRGIGFGRVLLFMRDAQAPRLTARFGYGADVDRHVGRLHVPLGASQDVFSVVLAKNVDLLISDVDADNIRARIPEWFRAHALGRSFLLLPIAVERRAIGLLYGDKAGAGELSVGPREMNLLKTLRNQAVLALRQRR